MLRKKIAWSMRMRRHPPLQRKPGLYADELLLHAVQSGRAVTNHSANPAGFRDVILSLSTSQLSRWQKPSLNNGGIHGCINIDNEI
ncbi:hypothetical protein [Paenibacillus sp. XY044]|uniref:hypothetical protein n=1 Tax=Paenibacillus sp. XY044 TaxID=2026089 RepID=UPI0015C685FE|nr:hypothetical protein [Paenibacillus sp. XY044]